jgi:hypothetical protein
LAKSPAHGTLTYTCQHGSCSSFYILAGDNRQKVQLTAFCPTQLNMNLAVVCITVAEDTRQKVQFTVL